MNSLAIQRQPWLVGGSILCGHLILLSILLLLPSQHFIQPAKPLPMVMIDMQAPIPLAAGKAGGLSAHPFQQSDQSATRAANSSKATPSEAKQELKQQSKAQESNIPSESSKAMSFNQKQIQASSPHSEEVHPMQYQSMAQSPKSQPVAPVLNQHTETPIRNQTDKTLSHANESSWASNAQNTESTSAENASETSHSGHGIASLNSKSSASESEASAGKGISTSPQFGAGYLSNPAPDYPTEAKRMGEQGKVLLHVLVTPEGLAKKVKVYKSSGSDSLDDAALKAVRQWRFIPAKLGSDAIEAWVYVPIVFKLN